MAAAKKVLCMDDVVTLFRENIYKETERDAEEFWSLSIWNKELMQESNCFTSYGEAKGALLRFLTTYINLITSRPQKKAESKTYRAYVDYLKSLKPEEILQLRETLLKENGVYISNDTF